MIYSIYFKKDCFIEVVCDSLQVFSFVDCGKIHDVLRCLNNSEIFLEADFGDVIKVVEKCFDAIEPYEKDVTAELRLQCKSSRGEGAGEHRPFSRDDDLMNFGDYFISYYHVFVGGSLLIFALFFLFFFFSLILGGNL